MKKILTNMKSIVVGTIVALLMISCSSETPSHVPSHVSSLNLYSEAEAQTKVLGQSLNQTQLVNGQLLGLFVVAQTPGGEIVNTQLRAATNNVLEQLIPITRPMGELSLFAYHPYAANWSKDADNPFSVESDQTTEANFLASDLMLGTPAVNPISAEETIVTLKFKHQLSKIDINLTAGKGISGLRSSKVNILNTLPSTTINPMTGTLAPASGVPTPIKVAIFSANPTTFKASAVIIPQTINQDVKFIEIELVDGKKLYHKLISNSTFEPGKKYIYDITVTGNGLFINSTVEDWGNGGATSGEAYEQD